MFDLLLQGIILINREPLRAYFEQGLSGKMQRRLILASASPRRRELLSLLGLPFDVIPSGFEENVARVAPRALAERLAQSKALEVWNENHDRREIVMGADTVVVIGPTTNPTLLGKPRDPEDARRMLNILSGSRHIVMTGVAFAFEVLGKGEVEIVSDVAETTVRFRELSDEMIDAYIATGDPFDKAGAYGIQGMAGAFVESIHGDYFNVVGLPLQLVGRMFERMGLPWWKGAAALECDD